MLLVGRKRNTHTFTHLLTCVCMHQLFTVFRKPVPSSILLLFSICLWTHFFFFGFFFWFLFLPYEFVSIIVRLPANESSVVSAKFYGKELAKPETETSHTHTYKHAVVFVRNFAYMFLLSYELFSGFTRVVAALHLTCRVDCWLLAAERRKCVDRRIFKSHCIDVATCYYCCWFYCTFNCANLQN